MKNLGTAKGALILMIFVVLSYMVYSYFWGRRQLSDETLDIVTISDDFNALDDELWYAGEWLTHNPATDRLMFSDGVVELPVTQNDKGPYLLSKPIAVKDYNIIKIKRKVKVHYGSDYFAAGLAVFQTSRSDLVPIAKDKLPFGSALVLVEYARDYGENTARPGLENIRLLAPDWQANDNYALIEPIFDSWFDEELIIDNNEGKIHYIVNGQTHTIKSYAIVEPYIRIWMHSFGAYTGHNVSIDKIEITLTYAENEALNND